MSIRTIWHFKHKKLDGRIVESNKKYRKCAGIVRKFDIGFPLDILLLILWKFATFGVLKAAKNKKRTVSSRDSETQSRRVREKSTGLWFKNAVSEDLRCKCYCSGSVEEICDAPCCWLCFLIRATDSEGFVIFVGKSFT